MAASFRQWELDPLFSAAEVVQDSADRMESIFNMLLHERSLFQGDPSDQKLLSSMEYHKRDLATALGTTKWQLEDLERAVNLSAVSHKSRMRGDVISRHMQFLRAIKEQITHVEKSLDDSSTGSEINTSWVNLNEQDRNGLALFLSGENRVDHHANYDSESTSAMKRFIESKMASGFDFRSDEIVELKNEENEDSKMNGVMNINHTFDSLNENKLRKVDSHYSTSLAFESSASLHLQESLGDKVSECGSSDFDACDSNGKSYFSKNKWWRSHHRLNMLWIFCNFWSVYGSKMARSFTTRQKDGEVGIQFNRRHPSSYLDISQAEKGQLPRMRLASRFSSYERLFSSAWTNTMQSCSWFGACRGRFQRSPYFFQVKRLPVRITAFVFLTLIVLGILAFQIV